MTRLAKSLVLLALLAGNTTFAAAPERVVSLDYCADQFVLKFLPRSSILALSPDAEKDFSYMREAAVGLPKVRPVAEDILMLGPDLVVRSYGGGPRITVFFERAGVAVVQVPFAANLADIRTLIQSVATGLGVPDHGAEVVAEMDERLSALAVDTPTRSALYLTPTGVTSGVDTLIDEMLAAAGLQNFERRPGWHSLPMERLVHEQPDLVAAAFFDWRAGHRSLWGALRHPVAQRQLGQQPTVALQGAWTSCGGWFLLDAVEALAAQ